MTDRAVRGGVQKTGADASPNRTLVHAALDRLLHSPDLHASARQQRLLIHLVEETLAGRADRIKAYTIATNVLGRGEEFDPQSDPIVRGEMSRLRQALARYYMTEGHDDELHIVIPKGSYVPEFKLASAFVASGPTPRQTLIARWTSVSVAAFAASVIALIGFGLFVADRLPERALPSRAIYYDPNFGGPAIQVRAFTAMDGDLSLQPFIGALAAATVSALTPFRSLQIYSDDAVAAKVDYRLQGSVRRLSAEMRVNVQLRSVDPDRLVWARSFMIPLYDPDEAASGLARQISRTVGDPYGVLFALELKEATAESGERREGQACVLGFYEYLEAETPQLHRELRTCHQTLTAVSPRLAEGWANLAYLYVDEFRFRYNPIGTDALPRALAAARRAIALDAWNARAHVALSLAYWYSGDKATARREADEALALNPNDPLVLAEMGVRYALGGDMTRGANMVREALEAGAGRPEKYHYVLALEAYLKGDYRVALDEAVKGERMKLVMGPMLLPAIYGRLGRREDATAAWVSFSMRQPGLALQPRSRLLQGGVSVELTDALVEGLREAGLLNY